MLIYTVDDEKTALEELTDAVRQVLPNAQIRQFGRAEEALSCVRNDGEKPYVVFSDIRMPGTDGLELALAIKESSPETSIIFVTAHSDYALRAFAVHASGFLIKPVLPEQIREELKYLGHTHPLSGEKLYVRCFGNFEVFFGGKQLSFKRRQSKELFAYLIDREGAGCTAEEIIAVLWEDEENLRNAKHNLRNLVGDMRSVFGGIGLDGVLIRGSGRLAVDRSKVDCDYFRMLDGEADALNAFKGEYMRQYEWAHVTEAKLFFKYNTKEPLIKSRPAD